jgi:hypothetical protein
MEAKRKHIIYKEEFPLSSRIKPLLETRLEALEHLFFNVFDVGEPVQRETSQLRAPSNSKMNSSISPLLVPEMLLANVRRLFLPVLGS